MQIERFTPDQFSTTTWSGGTTTQLLIEPAGADFRERNFAYRVSSASFTDTASTYSDFSGYERILFPLQGWLTVSHQKNGAQLYARRSPYEVDSFTGSWHTSSTNSMDCLDFNIITRCGLATQLHIVKEEGRISMKHEGVGLLYSRGDYAISWREEQEGHSSQDKDRIQSFSGGTLVRIALSKTVGWINVETGSEPVVVCEIGRI